MRAGGAVECSNSSIRKKRVSTLLQAKVRLDERQKLKVAQEERARRDVQEVDDEVEHTWTAAYEWIAKKMLKYLEEKRSHEKSAREN